MHGHTDLGGCIVFYGRKKNIRVDEEIGACKEVPAKPELIMNSVIFYGQYKHGQCLLELMIEHLTFHNTIMQLMQSKATRICVFCGAALQKTTLFFSSICSFLYLTFPVSLYT